MKVGTIAVLVLGILWINPPLRQPLFSLYVHGGGPIIPGKVFPFVFITIACGAISGFHALVGSGTTPKMISNEMDIRPIGYGAMLMEGIVGITALIACCALYPGDYFAINVPVAKFATLGMHTTNLSALSAQVGESVAGRTGGAVSLAIGMAQVFTALPGMARFMSYWYHFAILFEALFILTTIDAGTRVGRFVLQELLGKVYKPFGEADSVIELGDRERRDRGLLAVFYFDRHHRHDLADVRDCQSALGRDRLDGRIHGDHQYGQSEVRLDDTRATGIFVATTTLTAGWQSIFQNFIPLAHVPGKAFIGFLNAGLDDAHDGLRFIDCRERFVET